jgi:hypothetical protein
MKVKTFTGSETAKVDKRVNDWLAQFGIRPHHTNTAIGQFTVKAEDQRTGKPVNRRVAVIAISVWYEEPAETGKRPSCLCQGVIPDDEAGGRTSMSRRPSPAKQLRQLGDVGGDAPGLVFGGDDRQPGGATRRYVGYRGTKAEVRDLRLKKR